MRTGLKIFFCLLTALLLTISGWFGGLVGWFCFLPVLMVISCEKPHVSALYGALTGFAVGAFLFYGVITYGGLYYLLLMFYCSLNGALLCRIFSFLHSRINRYFMAFIVPAVWTSFEYLRTQSPISFPLSLGSSQYGWPALMQITTISGIYGLSFVVAFGNYTIFQLFKHPRSRGSYLLLAFFIVLLVSLFKWGQARIENSYNTKSMRIAVVQGSVPMWVYRKELSDPRYKDFSTERYFWLTEKAAKTKPNLIIWSESPVNKSLDDPSYRSQISEIAKNSGAYFLLGAPEIVNGKSYNSVFLISPQGKLLDKYRKSKPIPFAERYSSGGKPKLITSPLGKFGIAICFESIYPSILRNLTRTGAKYLFILTNDVGFGDTPLPRFHAREAIFRAVENRRWLIRAAQSGISMLIDPFGRVVKDTELFEENILTGLVDTSDIPTTFYTRFGDIFVFLCILSTIIALLYPSFKRKLERSIK